MKLLVFALVFTFIIGCADQSKQKYDARARLQGEADAKAETEQTQETAKQMEHDLAIKQRFFQAVRGLYKGNVITPSGRKFKVQFNIHPTIEVYEGERIRTADEVTFDMTNLALDIGEQTSSILNDGSDLTLVCSYVDIRPGVEMGFFNLEAAGCPRFFQVHIVPRGTPALNDIKSVGKISRAFAKELLEGKLDQVVQLQAQLRTNNLSESITFVMSRVE